MKIEDFLNQVSHSEKITKWINSHLKSYLTKQSSNEIALSFEELSHILDYFISEKSDSQHRLDRISVLEAHRQANEWVKRINKKNSLSNFQDRDKDVTTILEYAGGYRWVKLISPEAYKREGALMGHCVSSYHSKKSEIYSLRDQNNDPHCTIEVSGPMVSQIKGRSNSRVVRRYQKYIIDFLNNQNYQYSRHDLSLNSLVEFNGKIYSQDHLPEGFIFNNLTLFNPYEVPKTLYGGNLTIFRADKGYHYPTRHAYNVEPDLYSLKVNPVSNTKMTLIEQWNVDILTLISCRIKFSHLKTKKLSVLGTTLKGQSIEGESLFLNNATLKVDTVSSETLEFFNYETLTIAANIKAKKLIIKDVKTLILDTVHPFTSIQLINVSNVIFKQTLTTSGLILNNVNILDDQIANFKLVTVDDPELGAKELELYNISSLSELTLSSNTTLINLVKIDNCSIKTISKIKGIGLIVNCAHEIEQKDCDFSLVY